VVGFAKSYRKERPEALVKAVDVAGDTKAATVAEQLIAETLRDPGCVEIGRLGARASAWPSSRRLSRRWAVTAGPCLPRA
jgi:hypothetical protein